MYFQKCCYALQYKCTFNSGCQRVRITETTNVCGRSDFFCVCVLGCFYVVLNLIAIWTYKFMRLANATMFACYIGMMCRLQSRRYKWFIEHNMSHCKLNLSIIVCPVAYFFVMCSSLVEAWIMLCVLGCCMAWPAIVAGIRCKKLHEKRLTACLRYVSLC